MLSSVIVVKFLHTVRRVTSPFTTLLVEIILFLNLRDFPWQSSPLYSPYAHIHICTLSFVASAWRSGSHQCVHVTVFFSAWVPLGWKYQFPLYPPQIFVSCSPAQAAKSTHHYSSALNRYIILIMSAVCVVPQQHLAVPALFGEQLDEAITLATLLRNGQPR